MELLKVQEVAVLIDTSVQTINYWYAFKKEFPHNKYSKMLPKFISDGNRQTRYWKREDIWRLVEFKQTIPMGRNGVLGAVTQKYVKKEKRKGENYDKERK